MQTVLPALPTDVANAPVDENGLPHPDGAASRTCTPESRSEAMTCLVVYALDRGKVVVAASLGGMGAFVSMISIGPADEVVAVLD
ncbi:hypothetical protein [Actinophytocola xanthii]|uniref:Uncharacterized protein n=1 Tax=Actinophytocola xanthii TaxID=1912961 RepID=A0A1Q8CGI6_9PSEU|nr:hypothetical protein [Actinophytocola xanthii]OLF13466.1 hypothetical protein BU204_27090 [Actinophytocola xanthii]